MNDIEKVMQKMKVSEESTRRNYVLQKGIHACLHKPNRKPWGVFIHESGRLMGMYSNPESETIESHVGWYSTKPELL